MCTRASTCGRCARGAPWFLPFGGPSLVLWWLDAGRVPTIDEAKAKLELLRARGPTADAFTFREPFAAPDAERFEPPEVDAEFCGGAP
jgi:uncharacterized protein DUF3291